MSGGAINLDRRGRGSRPVRSCCGADAAVLHMLKAVPSLQIVAHRIVWSALLVVGWLLLEAGRGWLRAALARPRVAGCWR